VSPTLVAGVVLAGYLLGSLPFSYWVARRRGVDVRLAGSGNVGATNVMRTAGKSAGVLAFFLDMLKGATASFIGAWFDHTGTLAALAALAAVLGHVFPVWLRFRGGKGVATGFGALATLTPMATFIALVVFGLVLVASRYVSLASITAAVTLAAAAPFFGAPPLVSLATAVAVALIVVRHHTNIGRLLRGEENRIGRARAPAQGGGS
jgi:glycerol-3-phosphate acyltransferase PlsY